MVKVSPYIQTGLLFQPLECLQGTGSSLLQGLVGSLVGLSSRARLPEPKLWLWDSSPEQPVSPPLSLSVPAAEWGSSYVPTPQSWWKCWEHQVSAGHQERFEPFYHYCFLLN